MTSVIVVTNTADETAGSILEAVEGHRNQDPAQPRGEIIDHHCRAHHCAEQRIVEDQGHADAHESAKRYAVRKGDRQLPPEGAHGVRLVSWLVARARTATASVCVPALPPIPATIGISTASTAYLPIST